MKSERIAELRELLEAATPGPWTNERDDFEAPTDPCALQFHVSGTEQRHVVGNAEQLVCLMSWTGGIRDVDAYNAQFISAARCALPELLDEIERLCGIKRGEFFDVGDNAEYVVKLRADLAAAQEQRDAWREAAEACAEVVERPLLRPGSGCRSKLEAARKLESGTEPGGE